MAGDVAGVPWRGGEGQAWQAVERYDECRGLDDRGGVDGLINRHRHLRRYLPAFLRLPFAAQPVRLGAFVRRLEEPHFMLILHVSQPKAHARSIGRLKLQI